MTSISFENASYSDIRNQLQNVKSLWRDLNGIKCLGKVSLKASGNDKEVDNFQIFTPRFIVDDMIGLIGRDIVGGLLN